MRSIHEMSTDPLHWSVKIDPSLHKIYIKLIYLFVCLKLLGQPCYCLIEIPFNEMNLEILGFADGS